MALRGSARRLRRKLKDDILSYEARPRRDMWLARHPNVHFHYTPTHTSWLNQIEIWFPILAGKSLEGHHSAMLRNL